MTNACHVAIADGASSIFDASSMAIVHTAGGVRFVATAASPALLSIHLARYVEERCDDVLWPHDAQDVRNLLDAGRIEEAVARYFAHTGERWDREHLDLVTIENGVCWLSDAERMTNA